MADQLLADTLALIAQNWPDIIIDPARIAEWEAELAEGGGRTPEQLKKDILKHVVGEDRIREYVSKSFTDRGEAVPDDARLDRITSELLEGRQFSEFNTTLDELVGPVNTTDDGTVETDATVFPAEDAARTGVGGGTATTTSILTSRDMSWFFDPDTGLWYVSYKLPNSDRVMFFEATGSDLDTIFGEGQRPTGYEEMSLQELTSEDGWTFGGDIAEVSGTGSFEAEVARVIALALDEGVLPEWAKNDPKAMDLLFIATSEEKGAEWLIEQLSELDSFKKRFPSIEILKSEGLTTTEAVASFIEMEVGVRALVLDDGGDPDSITPETIGALLEQGHSLEDVRFTIGIFNHLENNAGALAAFNEVLAARGIEPLTADEQFEFMAGNAPKELYDIWEETSLHRAAMDAGLDIGVDAAIDLARRTEGLTSYDAAAEGLQTAAQKILQFRTQIDLGQYGLNEQDLIDMSLGLAPSSGMSQADIANSMERVVRSAQAQTEKARVNPFRNFTQEGVPQAASLSRTASERV